MLEYGYYPERIKQKIKEELRRRGIKDEHFLEERAKTLLHDMESHGMMREYEELQNAFGSEYATRQALKKLRK
jgi:hypothetical protein